MAINITTENHNELLNSSTPLVIDFWAEWCGPCRMITPIIEELAKEYEGKVNIGKCDIESNDALAVQYSVRSIPTIAFIKDGKMVEKQVGVASKDAIKAKVEALLK